MRKIISLLLILLVLIPAWSFAFECIPTADTAEFPEIEGVGADGFLTAGEYVLTDTKLGLWQYVSDSVRVEIKRYTATDRKEIFFVAHVYQKEPVGLSTYLSNPKKPTGDKAWPWDIATKNKVILATNGDFFADRVGDSGPMGIVIRNGVAIGKKKASNTGIPTLDLIALFPDGSMKCFGGKEHTAEEYLEMGATDTLCFGPILVQNGEVPVKRLTDMGGAREPRTAVGMVEPGHYVFVMAEGRTDTSNGLRHTEMGALMLENGCVEALNLDGGQTALIMFMGEKINETGVCGTNNVGRKTTDIVGVGYSELVE